MLAGLQKTHKFIQSKTVTKRTGNAKQLKTRAQEMQNNRSNMHLFTLTCKVAYHCFKSQVGFETLVKK